MLFYTLFSFNLRGVLISLLKVLSCINCEFSVEFIFFPILHQSLICCNFSIVLDYFNLKLCHFPTFRKWLAVNLVSRFNTYPSWFGFEKIKIYLVVFFKFVLISLEKLPVLVRHVQINYKFNKLIDWFINTVILFLKH